MTDVFCMNGFQSMDDNELMMVDGGGVVGFIVGVAIGTQQGKSMCNKNGVSGVKRVVGTITMAVCYGAILGAVSPI